MNYHLGFISNLIRPLCSGRRIVRNLRTSVFSSILRQEVAFFDKNRTGELINRLSADASVVGSSITLNLSDGLRAVAQAGAGVSMMVSSHLLWLIPTGLDEGLTSFKGSLDVCCSDQTCLAFLTLVCILPVILVGV